MSQIERENNIITPDTPKFEVPLNWSDTFLEFVQEHRQMIEMVYGSLPNSPTGRPIPHTEKVDSPDKTKLREVIETLKGAGVSLNV